MADTIDDRTIINNALARIGAPNIGSLSEDTSLCAQAKAVYYDRIDALLGIYDWSFNGQTFKLDRLDETPQNGFQFAYGLPGGKLSNVPRSVMSDPLSSDTGFPLRASDRLRDFKIEADRLLCNNEQVWAVFAVRAVPSSWPGYFRLAATVAVAADLCVPVSHDADLAARLDVQAFGTPEMQGRGGLVGLAIGKDAGSARRAAPMWEDPLTQAHLSGPFDLR